VALAVCLLFDRRSERTLRALWDGLEIRGVPSLRSHTHGRHVPHVSYAVLRTWDLAAVVAALASLHAGDPVELNFDGLGLFRRGRAWLLAGVTADFAARQERVISAAQASGADIHKHYQHGSWVPHCSIAPRASLAQLPSLTATVYDVLPLRARLDRAATGERRPACANARYGALFWAPTMRSVRRSSSTRTAGRWLPLARSVRCVVGAGL
jgi:hypothetical protein